MTEPTADPVPDETLPGETLPGETAAVADEPAPIPLREPRDGVPEPVETEAELAALCAAVAAGTGPVALDAERASSYRYGQRAYLVQLRRAGAGSAIIDPIALPDLSSLDRAIGDAEWVLHAASQDIPCLAEVGMHPRALFDTELAGRLLGYPRVGLATMLEQTMGVSLAKGFSAADWSTRPLPHDWLIYAALDVELLVELRDILAAELIRDGKADWAAQEFAHIAAAPPAPARTDPWRRTSGIHGARGRRQLAVVRALWTARDELARERDRSPGRLLPDRSIIEAARALPRSRAALTQLPHYRRDRAVATWWRAIDEALALPDDALPAATATSDGPPPTNRWRDKAPAAAARLAAARAALTEVSTSVNVPIENLITPDTVRRLAWAPPEPLTEQTVRDVLAERAARAWQAELTAGVLAAALAAPAPVTDE